MDRSLKGKRQAVLTASFPVDKATADSGLTASSPEDRARAVSSPEERARADSSPEESRKAA